MQAKVSSLLTPARIAERESGSRDAGPSKSDEAMVKATVAMLD